jgi:hypothetical protein
MRLCPRQRNCSSLHGPALTQLDDQLPGQRAEHCRSHRPVIHLIDHAERAWIANELVTLADDADGMLADLECVGEFSAVPVAVGLAEQDRGDQLATGRHRRDAGFARRRRAVAKRVQSLGRGRRMQRWGVHSDVDGDDGPWAVAAPAPRATISPATHTIAGLRGDRPRSSGSRSVVVLAVPALTGWWTGL